MDRKWHVEHEDGREWTIDELRDWLMKSPALHLKDASLISSPMWLLDRYNLLHVQFQYPSPFRDVCMVSPHEDMKVVWDA